MIEVKNNKLIDGKWEYLFSREVRNVVQWRDLIIVRLIINGTEDCINNIYALKNGHVFWQIQDQRHYKPILFEANRILSAYAAVVIYDKNPDLLVATDSSGYRYLIDPTNGLIVGQDGWVK